jgi:hypothetical protein
MNSEDKPSEKTKEERVREGMELLRKLREVGVSQYATGWNETKDVIATWVRDGVAWQGKIPFPSMGRVAEIILPVRRGRVANLWFRVI